MKEGIKLRKAKKNVFLKLGKYEFGALGAMIFCYLVMAASFAIILALEVFAGIALTGPLAQFAAVLYMTFFVWAGFFILLFSIIEILEYAWRFVREMFGYYDSDFENDY